jgi:glucuronoarabinoxylan endo-1,4-beta-xylanase
MDGFGINNNWAPAMTDAEADAMFDPEKGLGLSILRIGMAASGEPFNGASCWQDINKAKARGVSIFIGTLWSPPASCKTNNSENDGGHLKSDCLDSWSSTIAAFPGKVKQNAGVDLYAMSPQNEVDFASCGFTEPCNGNYPTTLFTASEYVALAKAVGTKLKALTPPVKLIGPEASEWLHTWSNESACCSEPGMKKSSDPLKGMGYDYGHALFADKEAWGLLDILGVHQYDTQVAEPWPADVPDKKPVWQTEMSGVKWWPEQGPSSDINNAVAVAGWIHNAVTVGEASAWLWWWWKAQGSTNEGLLLSNGTDTKRRYALGNYSRFIRPGYTRVDITGNVPADVLLTAYKGPDGTLVVVAINKGSAAASVPIVIAGGTAPATLTPWVTSESDNLASKTAVTVSGGSFTAALASKTVTTFVGK